MLVAKLFVQFGKGYSMSKIGRKPIDIEDMAIELKGQEVHFKGKKSSGVYVLPHLLEVSLEDKKISLNIKNNSAASRMAWGLHRALLFNTLRGAEVGFEKQLKIVGLGYKAVLTGSKLVLALGYSHKVDIELPSEVSLIIDKSGQLLTFKCVDKALLGHICSQVRAFRKPEPYKGTGIQYVGEVIVRKAGKTSSK